MITNIQHKNQLYKINLNEPIDISIPLSNNKNCTSAWYVEPMKLEPVVNGEWIGDVNKGGSVNFRNITFNPHGNGTHTECVGHISKEWVSINQCLKQFMFLAKLISVTPIVTENKDKVINCFIQFFVSTHNFEFYSFLRDANNIKRPKKELQPDGSKKDVNATNNFLIKKQ